MFPELFEGDSEYDKYIKNKLSGQVEEEKKEQWGTSVPEQYAEQLRKENKEFSEKIDRIRVAQQEWFKEEEKKREKKESELEKLLHKWGFVTVEHEDYEGSTGKFKQQIIDLVKKKVDGCIEDFGGKNTYLERAKQKLEEM